MATFTPPRPIPDQLATAVEQVRKARHHPGCRCNNYRADGAGYCTPSERVWDNTVNRLLNFFSASQDTDASARPTPLPESTQSKIPGSSAV